MGDSKIDRKGIAFLWIYRKEAISLAYLFLIGMAFGAIWIFYQNNSMDEADEAKAENILAFEEDHKNIEVVITTEPVPKKIVNPENTDVDIPPELLVTQGDRPLELAWKANAVQVLGDVDQKPQISIVIDDLGVVRKRTFDIINIEAPLTLSFLPYAKDLKRITQMASGKGHELMIHLPMEPKGPKDPGPHALRRGVSEEQTRTDLHFNLSQFDGYVGLNNHMGSAYTEDAGGLAIVLEEVKKRGLLVLDSKTSQKSILAKMAQDQKIPNMTRDFFLDNNQDVDYILSQLKKAEAVALKRGNAIAIGHPYKETIQALNLWLPTLKEKGIALVPLSHIYKQKYDEILLAKGRLEVAPAH